MGYCEKLKIAILERIDLSIEQKARLEAIGNVDQYEVSMPRDLEKIETIAASHDVVVVNWIDPSCFILNMKRNSMLALMSTGYSYIKNLDDAKKRGVCVSNLRDYCTDAVVQHLLGFLLGISKRIFSAITGGDGRQVGFELAGKTIGIIGMGAIGTRFAEVVNFFGAKVITTNRNAKNSPLAKDVTLQELLKQSDVICISCAVNDDSRDLINLNNIKFLKAGVVIISCVWNVISDAALEYGFEEKISFAAFDVPSHQFGNLFLPNSLKKYYNNKMFLTPWTAYNTIETETRQIDMLCENIEKFSQGQQFHII